MLGGLIIFAVYHALYTFPAEDIRKGIWIVVWMAFIGSWSYVGSFGTGNLHWVAFRGHETQAWRDFRAA